MKVRILKDQGNGINEGAVLEVYPGGGLYVLGESSVGTFVCGGDYEFIEEKLNPTHQRFFRDLFGQDIETITFK